MQALILAGGQGTRLHPYTMVLPKPLMPVGDYPILEIILRQLKAAGCSEAILAVGYLSHLFESFFGDGERLGMKITYSYEEEPLGTAGPIGMAWELLEDNFMVMNGDLLTTLSYDKIFAAHCAHGDPATIGVYTRDVHIDFGVIEADDAGAMTSYTEKPTLHYDVSMGINVFNKAGIQRHITPGARLDIPDLIRAVSASGETVHTYREACRWLDIGRIDDCQHANEVFLAHREEFLSN